MTSRTARSRPPVLPPRTQEGALPQTLHAQIREELRARIVAGDFAGATRLPSESELMRQYGVSRITVRQALSDLERERVIFKVAGKGSFVNEQKPFQELGRLQGFAEAMGAMGHETFNRVLSISRVPASSTVAARLALRPGSEAMEIRRVRFLDRAPVSLDLTWVPVGLGERLAREDLTTRDIFLIIENQCRIPLGHAELSIGAALAERKVASHLKLKPGAPVLQIERVTYTAAGAPIDYEQIYCRSDNFQYRLRLSRRP